MASDKSPESKSKTSRTRNLNKIGFMGWKYKSSKNSKSSSSQLVEPGQGDLRASKDASGPIPPVRSASLPAHKLAPCNLSNSENAPLPAATHTKGKSDGEAFQIQGPQDSGSEHDAVHDVPTSMDFSTLNKQPSSQLVSKNKKSSGLVPGLGRRKSTKKDVCSNGQAESQTCDKVDASRAERKFKRRSGRSFRIFRSKSSISSTHESEAATISSTKPMVSMTGHSSSSKDSHGIESPSVNISEMRDENVEAKFSDSRSTIDSNNLQPDASYLTSSSRDSLDEDETEGWAQVAAF